MQKAIGTNLEATVSLAKMRELLEVSRLLAVQVDLGHLLPMICKSATTIIGADRCSLFLYDAEHNELWTKVAMGIPAVTATPGGTGGGGVGTGDAAAAGGGTGEIRVPASAGIVGLVFQTREMLVIPDAYADSRFNRGVDLKTGYRTHNLLTAPVFDLAGNPVAVLQVINKLVDGKVTCHQAGSDRSHPEASEVAPFNATDEVVTRLLADQVGVAIQRFHLQQKALEATAMQREMDLARKVQEGMLPRTPPTLRGLSIGGWNRPASTTGGDAYDFWLTKDGHLAVFVADATGHGIAPALVVSQARALVRVLSDDTFEPTEILARVNGRLSQDLDSGMFVTAFLGILSPEGELRWCSAGHGPVLLRQDQDAEIRELEPPAAPLGVMPDFTCDSVPVIRLGTGGWLAIITDGVTESWSPDKHQLGQERLVDCLGHHGSRGPTGVIDAIKGLLSDWQKSGEPTDDQTVVFVSRTSER